MRVIDKLLQEFLKQTGRDLDSEYCHGARNGFQAGFLTGIAIASREEDIKKHVNDIFEIEDEEEKKEDG